MKKIIILMIIASLLVFANVGLAEVEYDFEGETVTIASFHGGVANDFMGEGEAAAQQEAVEEMFNVNIEWEIIDWAEYDFVEEVMSSMIAGDPVGDILYLQSPMLEELAVEGVLYPLDDVLDNTYWKEKVMPTHSNKNVYSIAGTVYGFPTNDLASLFDRDLSGGAQIVFNKDLLKREGIDDDLYELALNHEWTWDKLFAICKEVTRDTNGDGEIDQFGIHGGPWPWLKDTITTAFAFANNANIVKEKDGEMKFVFNEEEALDALYFLRKLDEEGVVGGGYRDGFANGNIAFVVAGGIRAYYDRDMKDDYGLLPIPMGPAAEDYRPVSSFTGAALPVTIEHDPKALIELMSALTKSTVDYRDQSREEYMDTILENVDNMARDPETVEMRKIILKKWEAYKYRSIFTEYVDSPARNSVLGEMSPAAAMEEVQPTVQGILDDMFDQ